MPESTPDIVGFSFQEIPLDEALNVVLAGDGNYSELKQTLLEKLPQLSPDKAFAFGLPNGKEVPEDNRRGLCMAINATLKRAKLNWRITYSGTKKIFVCVPRTSQKMQSQKSETYVPRSKWNLNNDEKIIIPLWKKGMSVKEIATQTGLNIERIKYLCYNVHPRKSLNEKSPEKPTEKSNGKMSAPELVQLAKMVLNYSGDFKGKGLETKIIRRAVSVIGLKDLGLSPKDLAPLVGITSDGVYFNANLATSNTGTSEISVLRKAVKRED